MRYLESNSVPNACWVSTLPTDLHPWALDCLFLKHKLWWLTLLRILHWLSTYLTQPNEPKATQHPSPEAPQKIQSADGRPRALSEAHRDCRPSSPMSYASLCSLSAALSSEQHTKAIILPGDHEGPRMTCASRPWMLRAWAPAVGRSEDTGLVDSAIH